MERIVEILQKQEITGVEMPTIQKVVCLGDSITRGMVSANYVEMLQRRLGGSFRFYNAGVNGDHSINLLRRLHRVIAEQPDFVVILVGTNDINADVTPSFYWIGRFVKRVFRRSTVESYHDNLLEIVRSLKAKTSAQIALASPPLVGEDLDSTQNQRAREYSLVLSQIAAAEGVAYLPVHEKQEAFIRDCGGSHGGEYTHSLLRSAELIFCHLILRESYASISRRRGYCLVTDGIHLNERGAEIIADEIETFLQGASHRF